MERSVIFSLLLLALVSSARGQAGCDPNPCTAAQTCHHDEEHGTVCLDPGYRAGNCSMGVFQCHDLATCKETADHKAHICECIESAEGDGYKDGTGCNLPFKVCGEQSDCPQFADCNMELGRCECHDGFLGSGFQCTDIDECADPNTCGDDQYCLNKLGGYECHCDGSRNFIQVAEGPVCKEICLSHNDCDWERARCNKVGDNNVCQCKEGYTGDGKTCTDINECESGEPLKCHEKATCENTQGGYNCKCTNGYSGDGETCTALPTKCEEVPGRRHKRYYTIDPDGEGPINAIKVRCFYIERRHWAAAIVPKGNFPVKAPEVDAPLDIDYGVDPEAIKAFMDQYPFCSQKFSFSCAPGFPLFPGTAWVDISGNSHNNWGSSLDDNCACGQLEKCNRCYCDGTQTDASTTDYATVVDKEQLPLVKMTFSDGRADKGRVDVEPLMCSMKPFDLPVDCHEAKFKYEITENSAQYIDVDGPGGEPPMLVYCDMESYEHVGITELPVLGGSTVEVTTEAGTPVEYPLDHGKMKAVINGSVFCSQSVEFQCKNSRVGGADGAAVYVTGEVQKLDFFPGAAGKQDSCGCGAAKSCLAPEVTCNCNIDDGQEHKDFGLLIDKSQLPVTKVTAQYGGASSSTYTIGPLRCSQKQFSIEPNCAKYLATGVTESHSYFIDPDGDGGQDPFVVHCDMVKSPPMGRTIIHHENEGDQEVTSSDFPIDYVMASPEQINGLLGRSTFCTQDISVGCQQITVPAGSILWTGNSEGPPGAKTLSDYQDCGESCECLSGNGRDETKLMEKDLLPVNKLDFSALISDIANGGLSVNVGPLVCSEIFPSCKHLHKFVKSGNAVEGEATVVSGSFAIDPDGPGGEDPFEVECKFPDTIVGVEDGTGTVGPQPGDPLTPVEECFDISYTTKSGVSVSAGQAAALVAASNECTQKLSLTCSNAPASKAVNFTTCDGRTVPGWAGSYGKASCACGVNGNCAGGPDALCNCDKVDGKTRVDEGDIFNHDRLPICKICMRIDPPSDGSGWPSPAPSLKFEVSKLVCDQKPKTFGSCQQARRDQRLPRKPVEVMRPMVGNPPVPIGCVLHRDPPMGIITVKPKDPVQTPEPGKPVDIKINYITIDLTLVGSVLSSQKYCSQKVYLYCADEVASVLGGDYAWYGRDDKPYYEWTPLADDGVDVKRNCDEHSAKCNSCGKPKGFLLTNKDILPVTRLVLNGKVETIVIENTECFELMKSCQDIYDQNERSVGYFGRNRYVIDPDEGGPLRPFRVLCEFDRENDNGVTLIEAGGEWSSPHPVQGEDDEAKEFDLALDYNFATTEQINALAQISKFCWQGVSYSCKNAPFLGDATNPASYLTLYNTSKATSFGTGAHTDFQGCACHLLGTCTTAYACNCDDEGAMAVDQGAITDKDNLPVTSVHVTMANKDASAEITVSDVRCSAKSTALPKDCAEALSFKNKDGVDYSKSGEYLISPAPGVVEPYMVRCDFDTFPGVGVTVIVPHFPENRPLTPDPENPDAPTDVPYNGVDEDQISALVSHSAYCYQGVRYNCYHAALLSGGSYFTSLEGQQWNFWGGGQPGEDGATGTCACGDDQACAGLDSSMGQRTRTEHEERPCNCDFLDNQNRADAGVIDNKEALPVLTFRLGEMVAESMANLTLGNLLCTQEPINLNECEMGFHDCHQLAVCEDMENGYRCYCPEGYQGKGVIESSHQALANGRECIDDNECVAQNPCPYSAVCHNLPGTYMCECKTGYEQVGPTECRDIDECADPSLNNCGDNSHCDNMIGSYRCTCDRGYRRDGDVCVPVGQCTCFGDPHCLSFDNRWLHYMGDCQYVMATDGCAGTAPTFTVSLEYWKQDQDPQNFPFSWVKSVTVQVYDHEIRLEQGPRVVVDGEVVSQYVDGYRLRVVQANRRVQLKTLSGLEVTWDGIDRVSLTVPRTSMDKTCGLCGNYDGSPENDWTIGPACPDEQGTQTDNFVKFGRSWALPGICPAKCGDDTGPPAPECANHPIRLVEDECRKLFDPAVSPFKECLALKSATDLEQLVFSCEFDVCASSDSLNDKVCRQATNLNMDCVEKERVETKDWREQVERCEEVTCPAGQEYQECGPANPPNCLSMSGEISSSSNEPCVEGCFCPDGMLMEGDKCITPEMCGCFYNNGYIATGETIILRDCSAEVLCLGTNNTESNPVECPADKECASQEGVTGCYCGQGYVDVDGVCEEDACRDVLCPANMECTGGSCVCLNGFHGECGECVDINECETMSEACNGVGQICVNIPGSYKCECEEGFVEDGETCRDVNECLIDSHNCGDNSECINTLGSYICECCAGYKMSPTHSCIRDENAAVVEGRCCACRGEECLVPGKVCGSDGKTYDSYRALSVAACVNNDDSLVENYRGSCQSSCEGVICERHYEVCVEEAGVAPTCRCPQCSGGADETTAVCGTNGVTYSTICSLKRQSCLSDEEEAVEVESEGPCPGDGLPPVGPWSPWSECSQSCKQGYRTRSRDVFIGEEDHKDSETISCYSTCDEGPCTPETCPGPEQVCIVDDAAATHCKCPMCQGHEPSPVCARVGSVIRTFDSECEFKREACFKEEVDHEILEANACEEKPVHCAVVRKFIDFAEDGCFSEQSISVGRCYGGCDDEAKECCIGTEFSQVVVPIVCQNTTTYEREFEAVTKCECILKQEGHGQQETNDEDEEETDDEYEEETDDENEEETNDEGEEETDDENEENEDEGQEQQQTTDQSQQQQQQQMTFHF